MKSKKEAHCRLQDQQALHEGNADGIKPLKELLFLSSHRVGCWVLAYYPLGFMADTPTPTKPPSLRSVQTAPVQPADSCSSQPEVVFCNLALAEDRPEASGSHACKSIPQQMRDGSWGMNTWASSLRWENYEVCSTWPLRLAPWDMSSSCSLGKPFYRLSAYPISSSHFLGTFLI